MGKIFTKMFGDKKEKPKESKWNDKDKAKLQLKRSRDRVRDFIKRMETEQASLDERIKQLLREKKRDRALLLLRMKKFRASQLQKTEKQLFNLQQTIDTIDWRENSNEVARGLEDGASVLTMINEEMSIDRIQDIMDDTAEAIEHQNEITQILSQSLDPAEEADVEDELQELLRESLPEVPATEPVGQSTATAASATATATATEAEAEAEADAAADVAAFPDVPDHEPEVPAAAQAPAPAAKHKERVVVPA